MSDLLQRLVQNARGAAQPSTLRIEPVLASRYAGKPSSFDLAPQALDVELTPPSVPRESTLPLTSQSSPTISARSTANRVAPHADVLPATDIAPLTRHRERAVPEISADNLADTATPTETAVVHSPPTTASETQRENTLRAEHSITAHGVTPAPKSPRPAQKPSLTPHVAAAQPTTATPTLPIEQTQSITISIGHVEVRNATAPASATPRKPAFRPGVSLDAFLRRGGSDGR